MAGGSMASGGPDRVTDAFGTTPSISDDGRQG